MSTPQDAMNQPPTDSVLRRHYEQLRAAQNAASTPPTVRPAAPPSAPTAVRAVPAAPAKPQDKGIRGWLGRLFGG
ncbi:MAG TPA: hypothetical protein VES73_05650 [Lamprocystis sp. (in: g-proteobacteria)]|nr:hypothetical protein [Lamprocystis sp. (in: g-proteobacteria)]